MIEGVTGGVETCQGHFPMQAIELGGDGGISQGIGKKGDGQGETEQGDQGAEGSQAQAIPGHRQGFTPRQNDLPRNLWVCWFATPHRHHIPHLRENYQVVSAFIKNSYYVRENQRRLWRWIKKC